MRTLNEIVRSFGVARTKRDGCIVTGIRDCRDDEGLAWDIYEQCERHYKERIWIVHPDKGGDARECADLNDRWRRIKELFARKFGISRN